jgi:hypothetical protein
MHTMPSLLAGDITSGSQYVMTNDFEPLAQKKFDNFRRYVSIYPEYKHVFVCDNGQGDVRAAEIMFDNFPYEFEDAYVHVVQDIHATYGYDGEVWRQKEFNPFFFHSYPEAALHAASQNPPLIRLKGLQRICNDAVKDFLHLKKTQFTSEATREERRLELNQAIWRANQYLVWRLEDPADMIMAERKWNDGEKVRTPYGIAKVCGFDSIFNMYDVELDWRPLDVQVQEYAEEVRNKVAAIRPRSTPNQRGSPAVLATVVEADDEDVPRLSQEEGDVSRVMESIEEGRTKDQQQCGESSSEMRTLRTPVRAAVRERELSSLGSHHADAAASDLTKKERLTSAATEHKEQVSRFCVRAQVQGRHITNYFPPILPKIDIIQKKNTSIFPFLSKTPEPKATPFNCKPGDEVSTPYGPATVVGYHTKQRVVVVEMIGWVATGYMQEESVKRVSKSLFGSLLRQLSGVDIPHKQEFPYLHGTPIVTPFGAAKVVRPVPPAKTTSKASSSITIGLSLESWELANGKHPMLYCTVETARGWKEKKHDGSSIFSTLNTIVTSSRTLLEPFLAKKAPSEKKLFKRFLKDAAAVKTKYGDGRVESFRESDGVYEVSLVNWTLASGSHPKAYLRQDDITYRVAKHCKEGYPVLTSLGLSGTLASVEPTTGVHIVTIHSAGMVCYLQPESIVRPLKAAVGEDVLTPYGDGKVTGFDRERGMYSIALAWGAKLYTTENTFDRGGEGVQDRDGSFGIDWFIRFLFFRPESTTERSRSNSLASGNQSTRSGA